MDFYKVEVLGKRRFVIEAPTHLEILQGPSEGTNTPPTYPPLSTNLKRNKFPPKTVHILHRITIR